MKRTIITVFAILALALTGVALAQSSATGTAPQGTALNDPGQQSNNLNKPENVNPSPANTNGMTTGSKPYTQPAGTAPTTTATTDQTTTQTTTSTPDNSSTAGTSYDSTTPASTDSTANTTGVSKSQHLPRTASALPLLVMLGLIALSAGFFVRSRRNA
jgi:LPXTG-motif cell wall-anchored protein